MLFELKKIVNTAQIAQNNKIKTALASVVALEGSSYRRPGVRMLLQENGVMVGAVSGGCVEKEILRQAQTVFTTAKPLLMLYDGRYRLGCEGILFILIEPFTPSNSFFSAFKKQCTARKSFTIKSYFSKKEQSRNQGGTVFYFDDQPYPIHHHPLEAVTEFTQVIQPSFQLIIVGAEHDAVALSKFAAQTGWEVTIVAPPDEVKGKEYFPDAHRYLTIDAVNFGKLPVDAETSVVFMTHSYAKDFQYLSAARNFNVPYLGLLGPHKRREKLLNEILEHYDDVDDAFFEKLHAPAGINIGAETAQEIAVSIISEILSVVRNQPPMFLKDKEGGIHQ